MQIQKQNSEIIAHQVKYIRKLNLLEYQSSYSDFCSQSAKLSWSPNSRPDICYSTAILSQVTEEMSSKDKETRIEKINDISAQIENDQNLVLRCLPSDVNSIKSLIHSNASYATNIDKTSQRGYFIFLGDGQSFCHPIYWI